MNSIVIGILALVGLVAYQWAAQAVRRRRFLRWFTEGHAAAQKRDWAAAEQAFRRCARLMPTAATVHRVLGTVLAQCGKLKDAEDHLRLGASLEPRNAGGHMDLAMFLAYQTSGRTSDAQAALKAAVACAPELPEKLRGDPRFQKLCTDERFRALLDPPGTEGLKA